MNQCDVVIVGAGPYGLSAASHLKTIPGLKVRTFGEAMSLWKRQMPKGMFLRSPLSASHIAHPEGKLTFNDFAKAHGITPVKPIPIDQFVAYGDWFQRNAVPDLDSRNIANVEQNGRGFTVTTEDGETFETKRVVVAAGPGAFKRKPAEYSHLPFEYASHSSEHNDLSRFKGKKVLVVGAGQSALENAAILNEVGADVQLVTRRPSIHWLRWRSRLFAILPVGRVLYSPRDVGPAGVSQLIARPDLFRRLPRGFQDWASQRSVRPAGALWLMNRLKPIRVQSSCFPTEIVVTDQKVKVMLSNGQVETVDHVMFATGFKVDLQKYKFLSPRLLAAIDQVDGYPRLGPGLECSASGLHFLGAPSGWSYGPLARFVSGTFYSPAALTRYIARKG